MPQRSSCYRWGWGNARHAKGDRAVGGCAPVDLGEFSFSSGEADPEPFDLAEPAFAFGLVDAGDEVVADCLDAGALCGVGPMQRTS
jgi:hypothetical protein